MNLTIDVRMFADAYLCALWYWVVFQDQNRWQTIVEIYYKKAAIGSSAPPPTLHRAIVSGNISSFAMSLA